MNMSDDNNKSLWQLLAFSDHDERHKMMADVIGITLAWQIRAMRDSRGWSQEMLAEKNGNISFRRQSSRKPRENSAHEPINAPDSSKSFRCRADRAVFGLENLDGENARTGGICAGTILPASPSGPTKCLIGN